LFWKVDNNHNIAYSAHKIVSLLCLRTVKNLVRDIVFSYTCT